MTIEQWPPVGPPPPILGGAGRFAAWTVYPPSAVVKCPGTLTDTDRRHRHRGDRRTEPRTGPCPHRWGRAGGSTEVHARTKPLGMTQDDCEGQLMECPTCHKTIQFKQIRAAEAA